MRRSSFWGIFATTSLGNEKDDDDDVNDDVNDDDDVDDDVDDNVDYDVDDDLDYDVDDDDDLLLMSGLVAMCVGSAGGVEPPRDPTRLPAPCESAMNLRIGKAKLLDVNRKLAAEGKLNVKFDHYGQTWMAIGDNGSYYDNADWFDYDLDTNGGLIRSIIIDHDVAKCYKDWKNNIHNYFKEPGGADNEDVQNLMESDKAIHMSQSASGSSSSAVNEDTILQQNLGTHRGNMTGVGPTLPWTTVPGAFSSSISQLNSLSSAQLLLEYQSRINSMHDLVPPGPSTNLPSPQANDDADADDDDAAHLGD
ncbi:hypothetical protein TIFTF001_033146 [Ficus carica]|uniref:Uncharacterized protein n=1 Tax=Ficus carica TaxID=3494 RepID=A0AA88DYL5_FICCA|nr:hypothetical protein TIFTF001_033146 [Ficus carica]